MTIKVGLYAGRKVDESHIAETQDGPTDEVIRIRLFDSVAVDTNIFRLPDQALDGSAYIDQPTVDLRDHDNAH